MVLDRDCGLRSATCCTTSSLSVDARMSVYSEAAGQNGPLAFLHEQEPYMVKCSVVTFDTVLSSFELARTLQIMLILVGALEGFSPAVRLKTIRV